MPTEVVMPEVGESIVSGTVVKWLKEVGDWIRMDEPLVEIATDKANVEIPSPAEGILKKKMAEEGEEVGVGELLAIIAGPDEEKGSAPKAEQKEPEKREAAQKEEGEAREKEAFAKEEEKKEPARTDEKPKKEESSPTKQEKKVAEAGAKKGEEIESVAERRRKRSSPFVRSMARDYGINLEEIEGSGVDGRVTKENILDYITKREKDKNVASPGTPDRAEAPAKKPGEQSAEDLEQIILLEGMRKAIAEHMVRSKHTSPHVTTITEADMSAVAALRERQKEAFRQKYGVSLTYLAFIVSATVQALKEFPYLNSSLKDDKIILKRYYNIGVSVQTDRGLMTPVIRNADECSIEELAKRIDSLARHAREGRLSLDEIQGGTFSITNPGFYGALLSTPIINQPQAAILGVETIQKRAVVINDALAIRPMMYLCLSYDHRIVDGATSIQFLQRIRKLLEEGEFEINVKS